MSEENNKVPVYAEPEGIDYIIIKVKESVINGEHGGSLYETTRKAWRARLESAMPYKYVLSVVGGIVQEVYHVSRWYTSPTYAPRIEFEGEVAEFNIRNLFVGKMIPECYRQKGLASPFLYKKKTSGPAETQPQKSEADVQPQAEESKSNRIYITIDFEPGVSSMKRINVLPLIDKECAQIVVDNQNSPGDMVSQLWEKEWGNDVKSAADFRFAHSYSETELYVSDSQREEIYSDEEFKLDPTYCAISVEDYADDNDEEDTETYKTYLVNSIKGIVPETPRDRSIVSAVEDLINNSVSEDTFVPTMIKHVMENANAELAVLHGEDDISMCNVTFYVDLPQGEDFDPKKLDFISFDAEYVENAGVLKNTIEGDYVSMDAIIYDGKMYFCKEEDIDDLSPELGGMDRGENYYQMTNVKDLFDE